MIDWLTLRLPLVDADGRFLVPRPVIEKLRCKFGRIVALDENGVVEWEASRWQSVRSDSHQIACRVTDHLAIQGSPARVGQDNNVFGSDDVSECAQRMIAFVSRQLGVVLPRDVRRWQCSRVDVTYNFDLGSLGVVQQALLLMKQAEGGHLQASSDSGTNYYNKRSRLRAGKAYAKGPHLRYQLRKGQAGASEEECELADRLLRLELKLGAQFWRERSPKPWHQWSGDDLRGAHEEYFKPMVGELRIQDMDEAILFERVRDAAPTAGMGSRAWTTYCRMRIEGYRNVKRSMSVSTWQRHKAILLGAGIPLSQLQGFTGAAIVKRRPIVIGSPVESWDELRKQVA